MDKVQKNTFTSFVCSEENMLKGSSETGLIFAVQVTVLNLYSEV
jgi:hypothetical protein